MMKKIKFLFLFSVLFAVTVSVNSYTLTKFTINPHDSLLFDAGNTISQSTIKAGNKNCFVKVKGMKGIVMGEVLVREIVAACGENETLWVSKHKKLEIGDILVEGTTVLTSKESWVGLGVYLSTDETSIFPSTSIIVGESSEISVPRISDLCLRLEQQIPQKEIPVIKGIVTYENEAGNEEELAPLPKLTTKGKRSSGKHKKTRYSHEVRISESDTVDIIRVYKGAVEVTILNIDIDDDDYTKKLEKMNEDMMSGKITPHEMQEKMAEFQNFGLMVNELMQPLNVDEGFKCTVTKNSRVVEPLGAGDEDNAGK